VLVGPIGGSNLIAPDNPQIWPSEKQQQNQIDCISIINRWGLEKKRKWVSFYKLPLADPPALSGADGNLMFSQERRADRHYQELMQGRASGQRK